jgi:hypothetical protein
MPQTNNKVRPFFWHCLTVSTGIFFLWAWVNNQVLTNYNFQLTAVIVAAYFILRLLKNLDLALDTTALTMILLLVLSSTGGLNSPLFFLVYFLLFISALLFEISFTLTLALALTLFFANTLTTLHAALQLFSLLLFTPLALFFGKQYLGLLEAKNKIKVLINEERGLIKDKKYLEQTVTKTETDSLFWLSLDFKNTLLKITHQTGELLADNRLPLGKIGRETLQSVHESAKSLLKSGEKLLGKIDRETDSL